MLESKWDLTQVKNTTNQQSLLNPKMRLHSLWGKRLNWGPPFCSISLLGLGGAMAKARQNFKELQMPFQSPQRFCKENSGYKRFTPLQHGERNGSHWQGEKKTSEKVSSNVCLPKRIRLLAREGEGQKGADRVGWIQSCSLCNTKFVFPSTVTYSFLLWATYNSFIMQFQNLITVSLIMINTAFYIYIACHPIRYGCRYEKYSLIVQH